MKKDKVIFTFYDSNGDIQEEKIWVEKISDIKYQVKNIPFFAPNISYNDIISVEKDGDLYFDEIIETSEHSTIQIIFFEEEVIKDVIKQLELLNCSWEGFENERLLAIDVSPQADYSKIIDFLDVLFQKGDLDYKESCLSKTHSN